MVELALRRCETGDRPALAAHVFGALPGDWKVGQMPANGPAQAF